MAIECYACPAGLACAAGTVRHYFRCVKCKQLFVKMLVGEVYTFEGKSIKLCRETCRLPKAPDKVPVLDFPYRHHCNECEEYEKEMLHMEIKRRELEMGLSIEKQEAERLSCWERFRKRFQKGR